MVIYIEDINDNAPEFIYSDSVFGEFISKGVWLYIYVVSKTVIFLYGLFTFSICSQCITYIKWWLPLVWSLDKQ